MVSAPWRHYPNESIRFGKEIENLFSLRLNTNTLFHIDHFIFAFDDLDGAVFRISLCVDAVNRPLECIRVSTLTRAARCKRFNFNLRRPFAMIRCNGVVCAEFFSSNVRGIRRVILSRITHVSVGVAKQTPGENKKAKYQTFTHRIRVSNAHTRRAPTPVRKAKAKTIIQIKSSALREAVDV